MSSNLEGVTSGRGLDVFGRALRREGPDQRIDRLSATALDLGPSTTVFSTDACRNERAHRRGCGPQENAAVCNLGIGQRCAFWPRPARVAFDRNRNAIDEMLSIAAHDAFEPVRRARPCELEHRRSPVEGGRR